MAEMFCANGHPVKACEDCEGTGFVCSTCGKNGKHCGCDDDEQEAIDCQSCEGLGHEDCPECIPMDPIAVEK